MADTTRDFNLTRSEIVERAFRITGILSDGESLSGEQSINGIKALNTLIKYWQASSVFLWTLSPQTITTIINTPNYSFDEDVIGIDRAYYTLNEQDIGLEVIPYREYLTDYDKNTTATEPSAVALRGEKTSPTLYLWPTPTSVLDIEVLVIRKLQDMDTSDGNPDIPPKFLQALVYGLAEVLSDEYPCMNLDEKKLLSAKAQNYFKIAKNSDVEYQDRNIAVSAFRR